MFSYLKLEYKYLNRNPKWTCLTQLNHKIIIKRKDIICEYLNSDNKNLIIKNSCSLHYVLAEKEDLICNGIALYIVSIVYTIIFIVLILFIILLIRSNNRLYNKVIKLEVQNDHQFRNRFFEHNNDDMPPDYNDLSLNFNTNNVQFTNNFRYLNNTINNQFNNNNRFDLNNDLVIK